VIRLALVVGAVAELLLARLLPEDSAIGLYARLAAATILLLLPGVLIAEALGRRSTSATLVWSLVPLAAALMFVFAVGTSLLWALPILAVAAIAALVAGWSRERPPRIPGSLVVGAFGVVFGLVLWHVAGDVAGDGLFHLARIRKLVELDDLSLNAVNEFTDGGLHPGYAFPLWHGFLALVALLAGVDPQAVVLHEPSVLAPVAFLVAYEAGSTLFRSAWAGVAVLAAQVAQISLAPGHGGAYAALSLPGTASRQLLVPAALTLLFAHVREGSRTTLAGLAATGLALTFVHPTYALFLAVPIAGFALVRLAWSRIDGRRIGFALAAFLAPAAAVLLWLLPIVRQTASYRPDDDELARGLQQYEGQIELVSDTSYRLAPEVLARSGAVAVAALLVLPLAGLAGARRWAAWVLGGSLVVLALMLVPELFTRLSDATSLSQSRRAAGFLPFAFALAGGLAVLAHLIGPLLPLAALAGGIALQLAYPGDFTLKLEQGGGPGLVTWIAAVGGLVALAVAFLLRERATLDGRGPLVAISALLLVFPVVLSAANSWDPADGRRDPGLPPGLVDALREEVPEGAVVFADLETSYRIGAYAPVYVAANPPTHVADTDENRPSVRRRDVQRFLRTGDLDIPRRYGANWVVVDEERFDIEPFLPVVYSDARFTLYRLER
jgi:hypothetical protein